MDRKQLQKKANKQIVKREQKRSSRIFIFSIVIALANYVFWNDQFIGLDIKHTIVFLLLPLLFGWIVVYFGNRFFVKSILETRSSGLKDSVLSYGFMMIISLVFSYFSMVTVANVVFKLSMDSATKNKPLEYKTYKVESTFQKNSGRRFTIFSSIYYFDDNNEIRIFKVPVNAVTTSKDNRKIVFTCKQGFWGYYKIIDYKME